VVETEGCEARRKSSPSRRMKGFVSTVEEGVEAEVGGMRGVGVHGDDVEVGVSVDRLFKAAFKASRRSSKARDLSLVVGGSDASLESEPVVDDERYIRPST